MEYQNVSINSEAANAAEKELVAQAEYKIAEEELAQAKARIKQRIGVNEKELEKQGRIIGLRAELEAATAELETFMASRECLTPIGGVKRRELGQKVNSLESTIADLETPPQEEVMLPAYLAAVHSTYERK